MSREPQSHPAIHAYDVLGLDLYQWQVETLHAIHEQAHEGSPMALRAANESGKTTYVVAAAVDWFLTEYPRGKVVITSGAFRQVKDQLWPALEKFRNWHPDWKYTQCDIRTDQGGFAIGFSTDHPGRAEGWHGDGPDAPLFYIVDEAKTVSDGIFEAVDRCNADFLLMVSSPGAPEGQFFRCFHEEQDLYWTRKVTSDECPHLDPAIKQRDLSKYGVTHPLFMSKHEAEFDSQRGRVILAPDDLAACLAQPPAYRDGPMTAFADFAAGGDENVLAVKQGNRLWVEKAWTELDTMQACQEFVRMFQRLALAPGQIHGDNGGLGKVMIDKLAELGWHIQRVNNGEAPNDPGYANKGSEIWYVGARMFQDRQVIPIDFDHQTIKQLTDRKICYASKGRDAEGLLMAESKDDMRARGLSSPDRGDAIMGALAMSVAAGGMTMAQAQQVRTPKSPFQVPVHKF